MAFDKALTSHQCGLGSIPSWCHVWLEFIVGFVLLQGFFCGSLVFLPPLTSNSNLTKIEDPHENQLDVASSLNIIIYLLMNNPEVCRSRCGMILI